MPVLDSAGRQTTAPSPDLQTLKKLARAHLDANQVEKAMQVYARLMRDYPQDCEAYLVMGDCYLGDGDPDTALMLYTQALEHAPQDAEVQQRIRLARLECIEQWNKAPNLENQLAVLRTSGSPANPKTVTGLLKELGECAVPVTEAQVLRAAQLLQEIIHSPAPAQAVAAHLAEIDTLLPALLELNIRQAQSDGRPDLVEGLQALQKNIQLQLGGAGRSQAGQGRPTAEAPQPANLRVLVVSPASLAAENGSATLMNRQPRVRLAARALQSLGCSLNVYTRGDPSEIGRFDAVIADCPHLDPSAMELLAQAHSARVPILLNLEADLEQLPINHPAYDVVGLSTPARARAYATALLLSDAVCTPTTALARSLQLAGYEAVVVPDAWDGDDAAWRQKSRPRSLLNLGWIGQPGEVEDVFQVRRMVIRVLREYPNTHLVIAGDPAVYLLFDSLPESRRTFLPLLNPEELPFVLCQLDILLAPLHPTPFNHTQSDRRLLEAGICAIPWVASPLQPFQEWSAGGLIANTPDEWHTHLRQLVMDAALRSNLGWAGQQLAEYRRIEHLAPRWLRLLQGLVQAKQQPAWQNEPLCEPAEKWETA